MAWFLKKSSFTLGHYRSSLYSKEFTTSLQRQQFIQVVVTNHEQKGKHSSTKHHIKWTLYLEHLNHFQHNLQPYHFTYKSCGVHYIWPGHTFGSTVLTIPTQW